MRNEGSTQKRGGAGVKLSLTLALMVLLGVAAGFGTWSAFSSTTENAGNSFESGTVVLSDNDDPDGTGPLASSPMLSFTNAKPGTSDSSCMAVTYSGTLAATVALYGTTTGTGLDQYMNLTVTRGAGAAGFDDCTGFLEDGTDYNGNGLGVIYSGTLQGFADSYAAGIVDPTSGSPESWTSGESHTYKFDVSVQDNNGAQGKTASQTFTWEARNS